MKHHNSFFAFIITIFLIVSGCAATTPLIKASKNGDSLAVQKLISEGANINEQDIKGRDALFYAIEYERFEIIKSLISKGANLESKDLSGSTPLVHAASNLPHSRTAPDIIKLLMKSGADINAKSPEGETILDMALSSMQSDIVNDLIKTGVNLWVPEAGKARLFFVSGSGLWDYIKLTVGKQNKWLNQRMFAGMAFIDVDSGKHAIYAYSGKYDSEKPTSSIDAIAGKTYYFKVTQDMKRRAFNYALIKLSSISIAPITEVEAKEEIKEILKSKELK